MVLGVRVMAGGTWRLRRGRVRGRGCETLWGGPGDRWRRLCRGSFVASRLDIEVFEVDVEIGIWSIFVHSCGSCGDHCRIFVMSYLMTEDGSEVEKVLVVLTSLAFYRSLPRSGMVVLVPD